MLVGLQRDVVNASEHGSSRVLTYLHRTVGPPSNIRPRHQQLVTTPDFQTKPPAQPDPDVPCDGLSRGNRTEALLGTHKHGVVINLVVWELVVDRDTFSNGAVICLVEKIAFLINPATAGEAGVPGCYRLTS